MVHLILTGGTGLVGSAVLSHILSLPGGLVGTSSMLSTKSGTPQTISKVTILTRSPNIPLLSSTPPPGTPHANTATKIEVVTHKDFSQYDGEVLAKLRGADACIWALGVSQNDVDEAAYVAITKDYALAAAKAFSSLRGADTDSDTSSSAGSREMKKLAAGASAAAQDYSRKFKFIYISGEGATQTPKWYTPLFGRVKGLTEQALISLSQQPAFSKTLAVYSTRPGGVDALKQPWIWNTVMGEKRTAFQRAYMRLLLPPIALLWPGGHSPTAELGKALVELAVDGSRDAFDIKEAGVSGEGWILGNVVLRRLAGL
ncbi:uncharacterized protein A1O9_10170 [Exophiala aquamarina CBS 119918]|uniref:NAD(P)-binding domain-containing protein n=1 Tax=Exophiala aquamarina CBS 119918 TaxID=1182545 RepID=A0A072P0Y8_9EURO|nr:uncharacterized protein A1O9_10170 [Exophiala aquamarina CBS 119918]KEF53769.1 hypothetical protein A1O9_10170 [Exophiala aquamarina CBS 119918]